MTKRDVYHLAIRLLGIALLLYTLTSIFTAVFFIFQGDWISLIFSSLIHVFLLSVSLFCIYRVDKVYAFLRIPADEDEEDQKLEKTEVSKRNIIEAGIILLTILYIFRNLPSLIVNIIIFFAKHVSTVNENGEFRGGLSDILSIANKYELLRPHWMSGQIIYQITMLVFCYFVIYYHKKITDWILKIGKQS
jgi:hypothetical protein